MLHSTITTVQDLSPKGSVSKRTSLRGSTCIWDTLIPFLYRGRKKRRIVHLYLKSLPQMLDLTVVSLIIKDLIIIFYWQNIRSRIEPTLFIPCGVFAVDRSEQWLMKEIVPVLALLLAMKLMTSGNRLNCTICKTETQQTCQVQNFLTLQAKFVQKSSDNI